jgi:AcrR family transcriptional regulator
MQNMSTYSSIHSDLYLKNPESTALGKKIVCNSIVMIDALGFEKFTFKKLGEHIGSNESSVYRYFESKHALLVYLISWYWSWTEYKLIIATKNIQSPELKLQKAIEILTEKIEKDNTFSYINEVLLNRIIVAESSKTYHTKEIDLENSKGYYKTFKQVVLRVSAMVLDVNPNFKFQHMLISTVIEGAHHQRYFSEYLPALTDVNNNEKSIEKFYSDLVFKMIQ